MTMPPTHAVPAGRVLYLDIVRILAVMGVVAIHDFGGILTNPQMHGSASWWGAVVADVGNVWVVPAFIIVSGALLLDPRAQQPGPAAFYRKRLLRLGPAFVFWQVFYVVVVRMVISGQDLSVGGVLALVADGTTYTHLYFLWLIAGLYVVAPVLYAFLSTGGRRRAVITAAVVLVVTAMAYTAAAMLTYAGTPRAIRLTAFTQWLPYVGYFVAGAALSGMRLSRRATALAGVATVGALACIIAEYGFTHPGSIVRALLPLGYPTLLTMIAVVSLFIFAQGALAKWRPGPGVSRSVRTLSDAAFGVFLIHFVIMLLLRFIPGVAEAQQTSFWAATLIWAVVVTTSFGITVVCRRVPGVRRVF